MTTPPLVSRGGGGPPVLVLHHDIGAPERPAFYDALARHFTVFAPSHPGYDGSPRPEWMRSVRDVAVVYQSLLAQHERTRGPGAVTLVGLGFGGWIAAEMATMSPRRIVWPCQATSRVAIFTVAAFTGLRLGELLIQWGWVDSAAISRALAEQYDLAFLDLKEATFDPEAVAMLDAKDARKRDAIPVRFLDDGRLLVAVPDPTDVGACDELRTLLGRAISLVVADQTELQRTLAREYS